MALPRIEAISRVGRRRVQISGIQALAIIQFLLDFSSPINQDKAGQSWLPVYSRLSPMYYNDLHQTIQ